MCRTAIRWFALGPHRWVAAIEVDVEIQDATAGAVASQPLPDESVMAVIYAHYTLISVYSDYRPQRKWFLAFDLGTSLAVTVAGSIRSADDTVCWAARTTTALLALASVIVLALLRPFLRPLDLCHGMIDVLRDLRGRHLDADGGGGGRGIDGQRGSPRCRSTSGDRYFMFAVYEQLPWFRSMLRRARADHRKRHLGSDVVEMPYVEIPAAASSSVLDTPIQRASGRAIAAAVAPPASRDLTSGQQVYTAASNTLYMNPLDALDGILDDYQLPPVARPCLDEASGIDEFFNSLSAPLLATDALAGATEARSMDCFSSRDQDTDELSQFVLPK